MVRYLCRSSSTPMLSWMFSLDYDRRTVAIDAPVNWLWFTRQYVLFLRSVFVNGRQYVTQATGVFEACDYASGADHRSPRAAPHSIKP